MRTGKSTFSNTGRQPLTGKTKAPTAGRHRLRVLTLAHFTGDKEQLELAAKRGEIVPGKAIEQAKVGSDRSRSDAKSRQKSSLPQLERSRHRLDDEYFQLIKPDREKVAHLASGKRDLETIKSNTAHPPQKTPST